MRHVAQRSKPVDYLFRAEYDHRRSWGHYLVLGLFLPPALGLPLKVALDVAHGTVDPLAIVFTVVWSGIMLTCCSKLLYRILLAPRSNVSVSTEGIAIDRRFWSWNEIASVETRAFSNGTWLFFLVKAPFGLTFARGIPGTERLDSAKLNELESKMLSCMRKAA
jgi:hypothetical protein